MDSEDQVVTVEVEVKGDPGESDAPDAAEKEEQGGEGEAAGSQQEVDSGSEDEHETEGAGSVV